MRLLRFAWVLVMGLPGALALLLVLVAATWRGHLFGLAALTFVATPLLPRRWAVVTFVATVLGVGVLAFSVPTSRSGPEGAFAVTPAPNHTLSLTTLLPEIDQLTLGSHLVAFADPYLTLASAGRVRRLFLDVYRPMLEDPQFAALPTQLGEAYAAASTGQRFVYVPPHAPGERLPCVIFLHGSGGNFAGYLWVWKALADELRFVVVAPGFGFGNWHQPGGVEAVEASRQYAISSLPVDSARVVLAGLSNGGRGVMRTIERNGRAYRAVVLISAVVDVDPTPEVWRDRSVLLMHGLKDDRITERWFRLAESSLREAGARLTVRTDPEEDHFFIFSRRDEFAAWVLPFLRSEAGFDAEHGNREPDR
ncbi:MAG: hypothetical protein GQE15_04680 [Archangiaceae bacterium]|nr:hypothetical protein [Archangiaceae bacterium]